MEELVGKRHPHPGNDHLLLHHHLLGTHGFNDNSKCSQQQGRKLLGLTAQSLLLWNVFSTFEEGGVSTCYILLLSLCAGDVCPDQMFPRDYHYWL